MSEPLPNTKLALTFLRAFAPEGPWVLTAIIPDGKTYTETYGPDTAEPCAKWIESNQGIKNIYFMVNPPRTALRSKAKKEDVKALAWLHVDVDPAAGKDIVEERAKALKALQEFKPRPTVILDSGGGYQGFWKLKEPQIVDGNVRRIEELEAYNQQLELLLGGDHCFNLDRIMRLPGTINIPNEKKRKKGREKVSTSCVWFDKDPANHFELSAFTAAPRVQTDEGFAGSGSRVVISGNLPRIDDVNDLPVNDKTKMLIVHGMDPDDPTKWSGRSECLFHVICEMVRAGVTDDIMASVIMDPDFAISGSVRDKPRPEQYAARQIQRAKEEAIDPWLRKLNEKHAVISDIGGKCRVVSEVFDESMKRSRISRQTFEDFTNRYRHVKIVVGKDEKGRDIEKAAGKWWLDHPQRRQYETIVFAPGKELEESYNLWRGFSCEALPGDCSKFLDHIKTNICSGSEEYYRYLMGWMATAVQLPDRPGEVAVVLRGKRGTGKGLFVKTFGSLFGRHFLAVADSKHLVGSFNQHLRDCVVLFGDEAFFAGDKKHESVLKMLVTEEYIAFEAKGVDTEMGPNYTHIILSSNEDWVIPAGAEERRFFAMEVGDARIQDTVYFGSLLKELNSGGREAFLHLLLTYDLKGFEVRTAPKTAALREQKEYSFSPEQSWLHERLADGTLISLEDDWNERVMCDSLYQDFVDFAKNTGVAKKISKTGLGRFLHKVFGPRWPQKYQDWAEVVRQNQFGIIEKVKCRPYFYTFPPLDEARNMFDTNCGGPFNWPVVEGRKGPAPVYQPGLQDNDDPF